MLRDGVRLTHSIRVQEFSFATEHRMRKEPVLSTQQKNAAKQRRQKYTGKLTKPQPFNLHDRKVCVFMHAIAGAAL